MKIDLKNCNLFLRDLPNTPALVFDAGGANNIYAPPTTRNSLDVVIGSGNLTYSEKVTRDYTLNKGLLYDVRNGDQQPIDVRFDFMWEYLTGSSATGAPPSIEDVLKKVGNASTWVSTDTDACRPFAINLVIAHVPVCGVQEYTVLIDFRHDSLEHDLRAGTVACAGRCNKVVSVSSGRHPSIVLAHRSNVGNNPVSQRDFIMPISDLIIWENHFTGKGVYPRYSVIDDTINENLWHLDFSPTGVNNWWVMYSTDVWADAFYNDEHMAHSQSPHSLLTAPDYITDGLGGVWQVSDAS